MIAAWVAIGAIAGFIPHQRVQWNVLQGVAGGVVGAVAGGWLHGNSFADGSAYFIVGSLAASLAGAVVALIIYGYTAVLRS